VNDKDFGKLKNKLRNYWFLTKQEQDDIKFVLRIQYHEQYGEAT
jgi:hypothetical protein